MRSGQFGIFSGENAVIHPTYFLLAIWMLGLLFFLVGCAMASKKAGVTKSPDTPRAERRCVMLTLGLLVATIIQMYLAIRLFGALSLLKLHSARGRDHGRQSASDSGKFVCRTIGIPAANNVHSLRRSWPP